MSQQERNQPRLSNDPGRASGLSPGLATIDCQTCPVRGLRCGSCMVPVVAQAWLGQEIPTRSQPAIEAGEADELTDEEWAAVDIFVEAGLVSLLDAAEATAQREVASPRLRLSDAG